MDSLVVVNSRLQQKDDGSVENAVLVIQDDDGKEEDDSLDDCSFSVSSGISCFTLSSTSSWQDLHDVNTVSGSWNCANEQKSSEKGDDDQSWSVVDDDDDDEDTSDGPPISTTELSSFRDGKDSNMEEPLTTPVADTTTTTGTTMTATTMDESQPPTTTTAENSTCEVCGAEIPKGLPVKDVRDLHDADDACKPFPPNMKKKECQQELVEKLASIAVDPTLFATLGAFPSPSTVYVRAVQEFVDFVSRVPDCVVTVAYYRYARTSNKYVYQLSFDQRLEEVQNSLRSARAIVVHETPRETCYAWGDMVALCAVVTQDRQVSGGHYGEGLCLGANHQLLPFVCFPTSVLEPIGDRLADRLADLHQNLQNALDAVFVGRTVTTTEHKMQPRLARFRNPVGVASAAKPSPAVTEQQPSVASCDDATSSPQEDPTSGLRLSSLENVKVAAKAVDDTETIPKSGVNNRKDTQFGFGGIAAAAALARAKAAAKTRQLALVHSNDNNDEKKSLSAGGGSRPKEIRRRRKSPFAVVAAASTPVAEVSGRSQKHPFAIVAAATAAVAKSKQREIPRHSSKSPFAGSGIAAAAAKAAKSNQKEITRRSSKSPFAGGGIAAAAAKAAVAKSKQREITRRSSKSPFAGGGIAAAAAKAAAAKGKKNSGALGRGSVAHGKIDGAPQVQKCGSSKSIVAHAKKPNEGVYHGDPIHKKYFKMLRLGVPLDAVKNAMIRAGQDPNVLCQDPRERLDAHVNTVDLRVESQQRYNKYARMRRVGLPIDAIKHAMRLDGENPRRLMGPLNFHLFSKFGPAAKVHETPLKEDPKYYKYFRMLQYGLPVGAVKHALRLDGNDPGIIDLDPTKSLSSQVAATTTRKQLQSSTRWKEQDRYQKYHKMLRMGIPTGAVHNAMRRDGMDPSVLGIDLDKSADRQLRPVYDGNQVKYHKMRRIHKMRRMGLPVGAVHHAMRRDGMDPSLCIDFDKSVDCQLQDEKIKKYHKMLRMGLTIGAVRNAMRRDGMDPSMLGDKSDDGQLWPPHDKKIKKYQKMVRLGLPIGAVRNAMRRDGMDPSSFAIDVDKLLIKSCSP